MGDTNAAPISLTGHSMDVRGKFKKTTQRTICYLKTEKKMKNANAQNSTFAIRTSRHTTKNCKRAVFLPTHPSPPTTLENSLTSI